MTEPPAHHDKSATDLAAVLLEQARQVAAKGSHSAAAARELFDHRGEYGHALDTLRRLEEEDRFDLFEAEVARAYSRDPQRLTRSGLRSALVVEWVEVLLEAVEQVQATLARADHFREVAEGADEEDSEYRDAMKRKRAARLRRAS